MVEQVKSVYTRFAETYMENDICLLNLNEFRFNHKMRTSNYVYIKGDIVVKLNLLDDKKIVDLKNLIIYGRLIIDIGKGGINLENVKADSIIILSAGENSVVFKNNSSTNKITISNKEPTHIKIEKGARVNIGSIYLNPCGNTLQASKVKMSGNFKDTLIITKSSLRLQAGEDFRVDTPIQIQNKNSSDEISFTGDFSGVNEILIKRPIKISGDVEIPPKELKVQISLDDSNDKVKIRGDFSSTLIRVTKEAHIECNSKIKSFIVEESAKYVLMETFIGTTIDDLRTSSLVEIEGNEDEVNKIANNAKIYGEGKIIVLGVLKPIRFVDGIGTVSKKVNKAGKYNLIVKVKEKDGLVVLNKKLPITVIE